MEVTKLWKSDYTEMRQYIQDLVNIMEYEGAATYYLDGRLVEISTVRTFLENLKPIDDVD